jgi:hypothetical protein
MGFLDLWLNWTSVLLSMASTRVLLNSMLGSRICDVCGLRQGDPLSPILFFLMMEVLNALIRRADEWGLFRRLGSRALPHRASMYASDLILFVSPNATNLQLIIGILNMFEGPSGLRCNL